MHPSQRAVNARAASPPVGSPPGVREGSAGRGVGAVCAGERGVGGKPGVPGGVLSKWQEVVDLMARLVGVPAALITRWVPPAIEIEVSSASPENPYHAGGRVVLAEKFRMYCQTVMERRSMLYVPDARQDVNWGDWQSSPDVGLGMTCYLGYPLVWPDGEVFGTICVMDRRDNPDVARYRDLVRQFARVVEDDLRLLVTAAEREAATRELEAAHAELERRVEERTAELRNALDVLRLAQQAADAGVWSYDIATGRETWSPECYRLFGVDPSAPVTYTSWIDIAVPEDRERVERVMLESLQSRGDVRVEFRIEHPTRGRRWISCSGRMFFDGEGRPERQCGIKMDVTERKRAEEEVRRANAKVQEVLESITDAFTALDREWRFTYVNEQAARDMGRARGELVGRSIWELFPEEVDRPGHAQLNRAMTERVPVHFEYHLKSLGRWFDNHVYPTQEGVSLYSSDITERKRMEAELARANARVHEVLESITDAFSALDREWRFTYVNEQVARNMRTTREALIGRSMWELFPEEVGTEGYERVRRAMEERVPVHYEYFTRALGRWFENHVYPTPEGVSIYSNDITERKRVEEELARANAKVQEVLESITDVFAAVDREWRFTYVNDRATQYVGLPRERILGVTVWEMFPELRTNRAGELQRRAMAERVAVQYERWVPRVRRWIEVHAYPAREGLAFYVRDITDRKHAERALKRAKRAAEEASRAKDHFIAMLSHELRTPLTPVLAELSAWERDEDLPAKLRGEVRVLRRNVELEARLIDDLLDSTRVTRGKVRLQVEVTDVHECIRRVLETCRGEAKGKGVSLTANLAAREHWACADGGRLQQVLWNLLNNGIKFTPPGGRVRLMTRNERREKGRVIRGKGQGKDDDGSSSSLAPRPLPLAPSLVIEVADTGAGIDPKVMPRLFRPFEQGDQGKARRFGGLGLGLTIAKNLVELHHGRLTASSEGSGRGSTFRVELPTTAERPVRAAAPAVVGEKRAERRRILLVEDDPDTLRILTRLLRGMGYEVTAAGSVRAAREAAGREQFDLLISDLGLPDGSGLDVMREVKRRYGIEGIAVSGYGTDEDLRQSREAGFQRLITKPVTVGTLEAAVRQMTEGMGAQ